MSDLAIPDMLSPATVPSTSSGVSEMERAEPIVADERLSASVGHRSIASSDLAYELQSKLFEQLAAMGVAGSGLVITLKGSILSSASGLIWMAAVEFGLAALVALGAQMTLIEGLFASNIPRRRMQVMLILAVLLIGMGIGTLGTSVFLEGGNTTQTAKE